MVAIVSKLVCACKVECPESRIIDYCYGFRAKVYEYTSLKVGTALGTSSEQSTEPSF